MKTRVYYRVRDGIEETALGAVDLVNVPARGALIAFGPTPEAAKSYCVASHAWSHVFPEFTHSESVTIVLIALP